MKNASVWPMAVLRGDIEPIRVGEASNIQDACVLHTSPALPVRIGKRVTVGHSVVIHGAVIGDDCLIGMGAILLDGCRIGPGSIIGAGALIPEGTRVPPGSLVLGLPGKVKRRVTAKELKQIRWNAREYVRLAARYARQSR